MAIPQPDPRDPDLSMPLDNAEVQQGTRSDSEPLHEQDESSRVQQLGTIQDHEDIEKALGRQADAMLIQQANEKDQKRLEKAEQTKQKLESQLQEMKQKLEHPTSAAATLKLRIELPGVETRLNDVNNDIDEIRERIDNRLIESAANESVGTDQPGNVRRQGETRRDYLIRTGKITPFSNIGSSLTKESESLGDVLLEAEERGANEEDTDEEGVQNDVVPEPQSHRDLVQPGFGNLKKKKLETRRTEKPVSKRQKTNKRASTEKQDDEFSLGDASSGSESSDDDSHMGLLNRVDDAQSRSRERQRGGKQKRNSSSSSPSGEEFEDVDDGNESLYKARLAKWVAARQAAREEANETNNTVDEQGGGAVHEEEWFRLHPTEGDLELEDGFRIPGDIVPSLFGYQQTGIQWLQQLHSQGIGGILGDEMGLGKTVQVISYLAGLHYSRKYTKPIIVVTPATVMKQWVNEFHKWWPPMRVSILHSTGSGMMSVHDEEKLERAIENSMSDTVQPKATDAAERIVDRVFDEGHVLITTYAGLQSYSDILLQNEWGCAILDEGHKIRNPDAGVTMYCKELKTSSRIILSGTPIQNNLEELWSLFDFIAPMRLGNLLTFRSNFVQPINKGGRANASNLDVQTAIQCAQTLKDAISPFLLQRYKSDVAADLPNKTEQVLFCQLTAAQRNIYKKYIVSDQVKSILTGKLKSFVGIDQLRKICNHPDLIHHKDIGFRSNPAYGDPAKSGKMKVVESLLDLWRKTGHKTLLFAQDVIMLDVIERFIETIPKIRYLRMDGKTPIKERQRLVDRFNSSDKLNVFILTTRVGGLGTNMTSADRVIIYDPNWNPSTDIQARERAWRLGQKREVAIYRLMTAGTIEEKIYHRQLFKQILSLKVLKDPTQRQMIPLTELVELFSLGDSANQETETGGLFKGAETRIDKDDSDGAGKESKALNPMTVDHPPSVGDRDDVDPTISGVAGLAYREVFKDDDDDNSSEKDNATGKSSEKNANSGEVPGHTNHLTSLFARSGVSSTFAHDTILGNMGPRTGKRADPEMINAAAKRVAARAAEELKRSEEIARTIPIGVPTYTGTQGTGGAPQNGARRGQTTSSSILSQAAQRQQEAQNPASSDLPRGKELMKMMQDFFIAHGGRVVTKMLVDRFEQYSKTPSRSRECHAMIQKLAVLDKTAIIESSAPAPPPTQVVNGRRVGRSGWVGRNGGLSRRDLAAQAARGDHETQKRSEGRGMWILRKEYGGEA